MSRDLRTSVHELEALPGADRIRLVALRGHARAPRVLGALPDDAGLSLHRPAASLSVHAQCLVVPLWHTPPHVLALHHYAIRYGIDISRDTRIGSGFYIGHFGGIFVNAGVVIGDNCNISQGVTLGQLNRGPKAGCPVIGNNVYIAPGAKVLGRVYIGDYAAIGANAVVVNDVAANTSVGGIPARPLSDLGSGGYVNRTDYPPVPAR